MSLIFFEPANPVVVKRWLVACGVASAGSGAVSIGTAAGRMAAVIPPGKGFDNFVYMALALSFLFGLPLYFIRKVLFVSLAQLGVLTGTVYLGYSLTGTFQPNYNNVIKLAMIIVEICYIILSAEFFLYCYKNKLWADLLISVFLITAFVGIWFIPLSHL